MKKENIQYFEVKDPKFARFYLLPKIHKQLHDVPDRPVTSNCGYYTENISAFSDFHLQPLAQAVKSYIKDTNDFLNKLRFLPNLPSDITLCTVDVVGLYPNIPHKEGLSALRKRLDNRKEKYISTDTLCDLKHYLWWRYIDDIFFLWEHGEEKLRSFINDINKNHPIIKFTAERSKTSVNFLDVTVSITEAIIETDLYVKPTDSHQYLLSSSRHPLYCKIGITYSQAQ